MTPAELDRRTLADILTDHLWIAAAPWPDGADALWPDRLAERLLRDPRFLAAREPAGAGLREAAKTLSLALSEFLISLWTGNTTTRRRDLDAAHAALRVALAASPAEPGLDVTMNDSRVVTGGLPDPSARRR